ncbi:MAG: hypothetical protein BWY82_00030 [Verrucomicrobia bacterium ADurb.Bin474]|nr:MAG: hypothetical protein BWY82_00030 [Verrucomicrobia bacterium ADurb.Bin474]
MASAKLAASGGNYPIDAFSILLAEGCHEYIDLAEEIVEKWWKDTGGHDPYYWYDILVHLPDRNEAKKQLIINIDESDLAEDLSCLLTTLCRNENARAIEYAMDSIAKEVFQHGGVDDFDSNFVLSLLGALSESSRSILDRSVLQELKSILFESLEMDRIRIERFGPNNEGEDRSLWIRDHISMYAYLLKDEEIYQYLESQDWYFENLFTPEFIDHDNTSLLTWSLIDPKTILEQRVSKVMRSGRQSNRLEGAIAFWRSETRKSQQVEVGNA